MRKHLVWIIAAVAALTVPTAAFAANTTNGNEKMTISPSKLSKTKFKNVKLTTETTFLNSSDPGTPTNPTLTPAAAKDVKLKFDNDIKFTTKGLATCASSAIENTTTEAAMAACGKAKVGSGVITACVIANPGTPCNNNAFPPIQGVVTAFNGKPAGKNPTILLHIRTAPPVVTTVVLTGTLKGGGTGDFGTTLDVPIPDSVPTAATDFKVAISKQFTSKGKKSSYVSARCADSNHLLDLQSTITYGAGEDTDTPSSSQSCSV